MIINPLWFYLINVSSNLHIVCAVIATFALIIIFISIPMFEDMSIKFKNWNTKLIVIGIVCAFISILTPSKETCYQMMIASLVTKENIEITAEAGKETIDYIVDSIDKLLEEQEED